jgi:hypothetical protein
MQYDVKKKGEKKLRIVVWSVWLAAEVRESVGVLAQYYSISVINPANYNATKITAKACLTSFQSTFSRPNVPQFS